MTDYKPYPITTKSGMNPVPDSTEQDTYYVIDGNNVRFTKGEIEKIGGHIRAVYSFLDLQGNSVAVAELQGVPRTIITFERSNKTWEIVGTHRHLYAKQGSSVYNITPLVTTASATLGTDPLSFTSGDKTMTVTYTAHGLSVGDRFKLSGATHGTGGFADANINREHIVATVTNNDVFTVEIAANAPATDATEGGAAVQIFKEISQGESSAAAATGPGVGIPGLGLPGSVQTDTSIFKQPRIWWGDMFGDTLLCGAGSGGKCYYWNAAIETAPTVIAGAPDADWGWIEDAKLVTFLGNVITNSNVGDYTDWTIAAGSYAYSDAKEDMNQFIARAYVNGENIIFAEEGKMFSLRWVGGAVKWAWKTISNNISSASPRSFCVINSAILYFMERGGAFFYYNGGILQEVPKNTLSKYITENFNREQRYKVFLWFNSQFNEIWMHYPSGSSAENDRVIIYSLSEGHFTKREDIDRTAADTGGQILAFPLLASSSAGLFQHEYGYNDDGSAMDSWAQTSYRSLANGKYFTEIYGIEPDLVQTGDVSFELYSKTRASDDAPMLLQTGTASESSGTVDFLQEARWYSWVIRSNEVNGFFRTGKTTEFLARGGEF